MENRRTPLALSEERQVAIASELAVKDVEDELSRHGRLAARTQSDELAGRLLVPAILDAASSTLFFSGFPASFDPSTEAEYVYTTYSAAGQSVS